MTPLRDDREVQLWIQYNAVGLNRDGGKASPEEASAYADQCVEEFRKRLPTLVPMPTRGGH